MHTKALRDGLFSSGTVTRVIIDPLRVTEATPKQYVRLLTSDRKGNAQGMIRAMNHESY